VELDRAVVEVLIDAPFSDRSKGVSGAAEVQLTALLSVIGQGVDWQTHTHGSLGFLSCVLGAALSTVMALALSAYYLSPDMP